MSPHEEPPPTLREIAKAAGASLSTVSCALRGKPGVSEKKKEQILRIARKMGWRQNPLVSAWLAHVRSNKQHTQNLTLGYIVSDAEGLDHYFNSPVYQSYHKGALERAHVLGFQLEIFHFEATGGGRLSQILHSRATPGIIVAPLRKPGALADLNWQAFSCAAIAHSLEKPRIHRAANDHFHSVVLAMDRLRELGYKRIGLILDKNTDVRSGGTFSGAYWTVAHKMSKTPMPPFLPDNEKSRFELFRDWYQKNRPDAVIGFELVRFWLDRLELKIPEEIGYANLDWKPSYGPEAGVDQKTELIGAAAVDLVTSQIFRNERGIPQDQKLILIESEWVDGPTAVKQGRTRHA
ncbi:MAG: LacI family DNA-binding transcriptional regulator [Oceanipulchritudo sp.]